MPDSPVSVIDCVNSHLSNRARIWHFMGIFECIILFITYISLSELNFLIRISAKKSLAIDKNPLDHFNPFEKSSFWTVNHQVIHIFTQFKLILR